MVGLQPHVVLLSKITGAHISLTGFSLPKPSEITAIAGTLSYKNLQLPVNYKEMSFMGSPTSPNQLNANMYHSQLSFKVCTTNICICAVSKKKSYTITFIRDAATVGFYFRGVMILFNNKYKQINTKTKCSYMYGCFLRLFFFFSSKTWLIQQLTLIWSEQVK